MKLFWNKGLNYGRLGGNGCPYGLPNALLETTLRIYYDSTYRES